jgi:hypothetical protein
MCDVDKGSLFLIVGIFVTEVTPWRHVNRVDMPSQVRCEINTAFNIMCYGMLCCRVVWYIYTDVSELMPASIAGGSRFCWKVDRYLPDYTVLHYKVKLSGGFESDLRKKGNMNFVWSKEYETEISEVNIPVHEGLLKMG